MLAPAPGASAVDPGAAARLTRTRAPVPQVEVIKKAYMQGEVEFEDGENGEDGAASPRNVGHNIYILAHQVRLRAPQGRADRRAPGERQGLEHGVRAQSDGVSPQLARHNKELQSMLKPGGQADGDEALQFYAKHTAQIEVSTHSPEGNLLRLRRPSVGSEEMG